MFNSGVGALDADVVLPRCMYAAQPYMAYAGSTDVGDSRRWVHASLRVLPWPIGRTCSRTKHCNASQSVRRAIDCKLCLIIAAASRTSVRLRLSLILSETHQRGNETVCCMFASLTKLTWSTCLACPPCCARFSISPSGLFSRW
jgi:hypothetical protein